MAIARGKDFLDSEDLFIVNAAGLMPAGEGYSQLPLDPGPLEDEDDDIAIMDDFDLGKCICSTLPPRSRYPYINPSIDNTSVLGALEPQRTYLCNGMLPLWQY